MKITKKKVVLCSIISIILIGGIALIFNLGKSDFPTLAESKPERPINNSFLTLMLEQSDGSYQESTTNTWPSGNYAFNSEMSRCENGGELRWDREEGIVNLLSNKSDACYVYFDLYNVVQISNVEATKTYNSITVTVTTSGGENPVDKYYFSIDGGNSYQESSTPSYTFSNLTMNHEYTIQVYAKDTLGYESNEETIEVTTDNYVNPVVNSVSATNITTNSITVSVSASGGTKNVARYYYSINNGSYTSSTSNTHTFSGLNRGTTYSIEVYVKDTNGVDSGIYTISAETINGPLLADVCSNGNNLASCIKNYYNEVGSDMSGIYYHNSSLANGAGDNSYRYAGANPNNYVCFGSDAATCPSNNLYRIIGVFGNQVKLIKSTGFGWYVWTGSTSNSTNIWSDSTFNTETLNGTYLSGLGSTWSNKIVTTSWKVGGFTYDSVINGTAKTVYQNEIVSPAESTTYPAKIGLMYLSDYGFAASNNYWTTNIRSYRVTAGNNWMCPAETEWTISRRSDYTPDVFYVSSNCAVGRDFANHGTSPMRPVFYLNSNVSYISGSGTSSDPIRLS